jgi:hypothetical protein
LEFTLSSIPLLFEVASPSARALLAEIHGVRIPNNETKVSQWSMVPLRPGLHQTGKQHPRHASSLSK